MDRISVTGYDQTTRLTFDEWDELNRLLMNLGAAANDTSLSCRHLLDSFPLIDSLKTEKEIRDYNSLQNHINSIKVVKSLQKHHNTVNVPKKQRIYIEKKV